MEETHDEIWLYPMPPVRYGNTTNPANFMLNDPTYPGGLADTEIKITIRKSDGSTVKEFKTEPGGGVVIIDAPACQFTWQPFLCFIPPGTYHYDIEFTYPDTAVKTRIHGPYPVYKP